MHRTHSQTESVREREREATIKMQAEDDRESIGNDDGGWLRMMKNTTNKTQEIVWAQKSKQLLPDDKPMTTLLGQSSVTTVSPKTHKQCCQLPVKMMLDLGKLTFLFVIRLHWRRPSPQEFLSISEMYPHLGIKASVRFYRFNYSFYIYIFNESGLQNHCNT